MANWLALVVLAFAVWRGANYVQKRVFTLLSLRARFYLLVLLALVKFLVFIAFAQQSGVDVPLFLKLLAAGGTCALLTHSFTTPLDVLRTKMQLEPDEYPTPLLALRKIIKQDGPAMLLQGLAPTAAGYFLHGALKYAWYEQFRSSIVRLVRRYADGDAGAGAHVSSAYYVLAAAGAEVIASAALCPLEAVRIRLVSDPTFARGMLDGLSKLASEGMFGMYKGLIPLIGKQVPYTVAQFWSYEFLLTWLRSLWLSSPSSSLSSKAGGGDGVQLENELAASTELALSLVAGVLSGVCAAVASQPGDTILSRVNQHMADDDDAVDCARAGASDEKNDSERESQGGSGSGSGGEMRPMSSGAESGRALAAVEAGEGRHAKATVLASEYDGDAANGVMASGAGAEHAPAPRTRAPPHPFHDERGGEQERQRQRRRHHAQTTRHSLGACLQQQHSHRSRAQPVAAGLLSFLGLSEFAALMHQMVAHMAQVARELGARGVFLGLGPRCVQVAAMVTGQFLIYGSIKSLFGVPPTLGRGGTTPSDAAPSAATRTLSTRGAAGAAAAQRH